MSQQILGVLSGAGRSGFPQRKGLTHSFNTHGVITTYLLSISVQWGFLCPRFNASIHIIQTLRGLGVCYDEIVFDKQTVADVAMGGRADNVHEDMEKEVF